MELVELATVVDVSGVWLDMVVARVAIVTLLVEQRLVVPGVFDVLHAPVGTGVAATKTLVAGVEGLSWVDDVLGVVVVVEWVVEQGKEATLVLLGWWLRGVVPGVSHASEKAGGGLVAGMTGEEGVEGWNAEVDIVVGFFVLLALIFLNFIFSIDFFVNHVVFLLGSVHDWSGIDYNGVILDLHEASELGQNWDFGTETPGWLGEWDWNTALVSGRSISVLWWEDVSTAWLLLLLLLLLLVLGQVLHVLLVASWAHWQVVGVGEKLVHVRNGEAFGVVILLAIILFFVFLAFFGVLFLIVVLLLVFLLVVLNFLLTSLGKEGWGGISLVVVVGEEDSFRNVLLRSIVNAARLAGDGVVATSALRSIEVHVGWRSTRSASSKGVHVVVVGFDVIVGFGAVFDVFVVIEHLNRSSSVGRGEGVGQGEP